MHAYTTRNLCNAQMYTAEPPTSVMNMEMLVPSELVYENHRRQVMRIESQT